MFSDFSLPLFQSSSEMAVTPIKLSLIGDTVFCFNADGEWDDLLFSVQLSVFNRFICIPDYMTIRVEHRIIGRLVGSTVKWPRNTVLHGKICEFLQLFFEIEKKSQIFLWNLAIGLPAIYSPYETQLLIDKGIVQLCKKAFSDTLDENTEQQYVHHCDEQMKVSQEIYLEKRIDDVKKNMVRILEGKRKKVLKSGGDPSEITEDSILDELRKRPVEDTTGIFIQVPTQEPFEIGMRLKRKSIFSILISNTAPNLSKLYYFLSPIDYEDIKLAPKLDPLKYRVFCDLWEKGNRITPGATFGGDFLVYPGEPLHFHASHIVHVLSDDEAKAMPTRIFTTRTRLSVNVNKLCTFVFENKENNELCYQTIQWMGK